MSETELVKKGETKLSMKELIEASKTIDKEVVMPAYEASFSIVESLGKLLIATGNLQKTNVQAYEFLVNLGENPQLYLSMLLELVPAEKIKRIIQDLLEVMTIISERKNITDLNADTKIELGKRIIAIVTELKTIE